MIIILIFQSCITSKALKITIESGQIPPEMATEDFTLIGVLEGKRSYDKYVEKAFANYTGKYVLATEAEIADKYEDKNEFRYIMYYNSGSGYTAHNGTIMHFNYYIYDRKFGEEFPRSRGSSMFSYEMRVYLMAIERIRKK